MTKVIMKKEATQKLAMSKTAMKKTLIATSIILSLAITPVIAKSSTAEPELKSDMTSEIIGFSAGAIIGGIIAGPIGVVAAGTIGLIIGQSHEQKEQIEEAEIRLKNNKLVMESLSDETQHLKNRLVATEQEQFSLENELALTNKTLSQVEQLEEIKLNLRFEIDSSKVESFYEPQIKHLAMMMQQNPELSVNLSGYSDPSGSAEGNLKLSQARTESVKDMLVKQGVDEAHIFTQAFGESKANQTARTQSSDFNERRVEVELIAHGEAVSQLSMLESGIKEKLTPNADTAEEMATLSERFEDADVAAKLSEHNETNVKSVEIEAIREASATLENFTAEDDVTESADIGNIGISADDVTQVDMSAFNVTTDNITEENVNELSKLTLADLN